jgi:hypothetical protein
VGTREAHLAQAAANMELAIALLALNSDAPRPAALQWAVTVGFYCSVHCIEAHLATRGHHSSTHNDRYDKMSWVGVPDDVYNAHEQLQQWSEQARYLMRHFKAEFVGETVLGKYVPIVTKFAGL